MKFWNYIGEFFLFRWLLGKLHGFKKAKEAPTVGRTVITDEDSRSPIVDDSDDKVSVHDFVTAADDNNDGENDESDDLDDLDIFMRNNSVRENGNKTHCSGDYSDNHYWNSGNYDQSFDNFHEEQDDYDMMDDF